MERLGSFNIDVFVAVFLTAVPTQQSRIEDHFTFKSGRRKVRSNIRGNLTHIVSIAQIQELSESDTIIVVGTTKVAIVRAEVIFSSSIIGKMKQLLYFSVARFANLPHTQTFVGRKHEEGIERIGAPFVVVEYASRTVGRVEISDIIYLWTQSYCLFQDAEEENLGIVGVNIIIIIAQITCVAIPIAPIENQCVQCISHILGRIVFPLAGSIIVKETHRLPYL